MILLDTHVLVWVTNNERKLGRKTRSAIESAWAVSTVAVSVLSFWEVGMLQARKNLKLSVELSAWRDQLLNAGLSEMALTGKISLRALQLQGLSEDPADRFIAATAIIHNATLVTADEKILAWNGNLDRLDASK